MRRCGKKARAGVEYANLTRYYGIDSFPEWATPAFRRFWLSESRAILEARDRLKAGGVPDADLYDVALLAFGSEDTASDILAARLEWRNKSGNKG